MRTITIKNIPEKLYKKIKTSAGQHFRSINSEVLYRLEQSYSHKKIDPEERLARIEKIHRELDLPKLTDNYIERAKREGRP